MARMDAFGPVLKTKDVSKHSTSSQFYLLHWFNEICLIFAHLCCSNVPLSWVEFMYMALIVIYIYKDLPQANAAGKASVIMCRTPEASD